MNDPLHEEHSNEPYWFNDYESSSSTKGAGSGKSRFIGDVARFPSLYCGPRVRCKVQARQREGQLDDTMVITRTSLAFHVSYRQIWRREELGRV